MENAHKDVFASQSSAKNPYADFQAWRSKILGISPAEIDKRIKGYCRANNISLTRKKESKSNCEKIYFIKVITVSDAVWDFLKIKGEVKALDLANLVEDIIRIEKGEVLKKK